MLAFSVAGLLLAMGMTLHGLGVLGDWKAALQGLLIAIAAALLVLAAPGGFDVENIR